MAVYRVGSNKSSVNNFPVIRPTLDLDFANSKTLDPRITFTRASGGSYVGADGLIKYAGVNEARFDHDPATGESLGLLVEESRTNLVTDSIILSNMPDKTNVTVKNNVITSPTGVQNVSKIIETNVNGSHSLSRINISTTSNVSYTISGYFKRAERKNVSLSFRNITFWGTPSSPGAVFNLESGTVLSTSGVLNSVSIIYAGNGWYRCSITATRDNNGIIPSGIYVRICNDDGNTFYQGIEGHGLYAWGLQFEAGSFVTSFIPTIGSTRTRAADNTTITGKNFSEWYRQDEGTICIESTNLSVHGGSNRFPYLAQIDDGTNNNRISFDFSVLSFEPPLSRFNGYRYNFVVTSNGVTLAEIGPAGSSKNSAKWVAGIKSNDFITTTSAFPGITYKSSNGTPKNTMNRLQLGAGFGARFTGTIKKLTYYPKRLPDSQLQALTR